MRSLISLIFFFSLIMQSISQQLPDKKSVSINLSSASDTIKLDSMTVNPESIKLDLSGETFLDTSAYTFDINKGFLILKKDKLPKTGDLKISWKSMNVNLSKEYKHKDTSLLFPELKNFYEPFATKESSNSWFETSDLEKSGSITRGFNIGNRQDFSLNSSLNLMLSGKLNNDLEIQAAISDNKIPVQPEGNTQQIQEFDKIFIRLSKSNTAFTAGDIVVEALPANYFLKYNRKAQGGDFQTKFSTNKKNSDEMFVRANASFGKGRYSRQEIKTVEGNLGPYKLKGNNDETFIIVLAGTEKIFIDGIQLTRGEENNYIIDYNLAEVTFTTKTTITAKSRVIIEFEYSDRNYSRSLITSDIAYKSGKFKSGFSLYSESDMKNQSIQQNLTNEQKKIMSLIGDSLQNAFARGIDSIGFNNERVMYAMIDSLGYDSVFVYSTNPDSANYALNFSFVGKNNGNYVQTGSSANGRVFKWVAPASGVPQGDYEPIILLVTPKKSDVYAFRAGYDFNKNTSINAEYAISNNDLNLFSKIHDNDNIGHAVVLNFKNISKLSSDSVKNWTIQTNITTEFTEKNFEEIERFRSVEFNRNWNLDLMNNNKNSYFTLADILLQNKLSDKIRVSSGFFTFGQKENSFQNLIQVNKKWKKTASNNLISYLISPANNNKTNFLQYESNLEQKIWKFNVGAEAKGESKSIKSQENNFYHQSSFDWWHAKFYSAYTDSSFNAKIFYQYREDKITDSLKFIPQSYMTDIGFESNGKINDFNTLLVRATYRKVAYSSDATPDENFLLGHFEYNGRVKKRFLIFGANYEAGSGMEAKKEFTYIEVTPGQGVFTWNDYNKNNIRELNEFESAIYSDQANYIRVFTPTNEYIRVFSSQLNGNFSITPSEILKQEKFVGKTLAKLSNRSAFSWNKKTSSNKIAEMYLPLYSIPDDTLLAFQNSTFRNTLTFRSSDSRFSINWTNSSNKNRGLLTNGIEDRSTKQDEIKINKTFFKSINAELSAKKGLKSFYSQFFKTNNYNIDEQLINPSVSLQPNTNIRYTLLFEYSEKNNLLAFEKSIIRKAGIELKYSKTNKGMAIVQFNFLQISFNSSTNSNIGYIMLDGLQAGKNYTWKLSLQRKLGNNMQLNFMYDGRSSKGSPVVHTGNVQLRVFF